MRHEQDNRPLVTRLSGVWPQVLCAALGFGAGLVNGLLGAAGGILLVTVLPWLPAPSFFCTAGEGVYRPLGRYLDRKDIFATALAVMLPVSAVSFLRYWLGGIRPDPAELAMLLLPAALGGLAGAWLLERISPRTLRLLFAGLVAVSGVRMLF